MKKLVALVMALLMALSCCIALADDGIKVGIGSDPGRFEVNQGASLLEPLCKGPVAGSGVVEEEHSRSIL